MEKMLSTVQCYIGQGDIRKLLLTISPEKAQTECRNNFETSCAKNCHSLAQVVNCTCLYKFYSYQYTVIAHKIYAHLFILNSVYSVSCCLHSDQLFLKLPTPHKQMSSPSAQNEEHHEEPWSRKLVSGQMFRSGTS
jgi:hypothetical protein